MGAPYLNSLPLYSSGLGWVVPTLAGFAVGFVISKVGGK